MTERNASEAVLRGLKCKCPNCGKGSIFAGYLKVTPQCSACGEDYTGHQADDMPPYLSIFLVGHIVVPLLLYVEVNYAWSMTLHMVVWPLLCVVLCLISLPLFKGAVVALQWAHKMHGFAKKT